VSLISDALRKARQDSAAGGDLQRGIELPLAKTGRSRLGVGLVLGAVIALAAALAGAAVVWWALDWANDEVVAVQSTPSDAGAPSDPEAAAHTLAGTSEPAPGVVASESASMTQPSAGEAADAEAADPIAAGLTEPALDPEPAGEEPGSSAEDTAAAVHDQPGEEGARVFAVDADLGHVVLSLDYVVYRSDDPFAQINGTEVHIGSIVAGLVVDEIGPNHVRLHDEDGPVVIRVR